MVAWRGRKTEAERLGQGRSLGLGRCSNVLGNSGRNSLTDLGRVFSEARLLFYLNSFSGGAWVRSRLCGRRALNVHLASLRALDLYRVCQIADRLDVSVDWLLGRSDVMVIPRKGTRVA
jgi:hypothetical protein